MKNTFLPSVVFALILTTSARSEDWTQYRGPRSNGKSSESLGTLSPEGPKVLWNVPAALGFSSFSVANRRAFTLVVDDEKRETLLALDVDTGKKLWTAAIGSAVYKQGGGNAGAKDNRGGDGPRSTPSTDGKRVYVYDSYMLLSCFDARTGNLVWKRDIATQYAGRNIKWLNATSPLLDGNMLFVGGGGAGQSFIAFNKNSGKMIWKSGDEKITHATPHLTTFDNTKQLVFFTQSGLVSVEAESGKELWRTKFPYSVSTAASPVSSANYIYCSAGYGVGAGLFQVNGNVEPEEIWFKSNELMNHWSTPVIHEDYLYGIYEFKKYGKAPLQCIDMKSGEIVWEHRGFGPGNCVLVGNKLLVLSDAGELVIVSARSDKYEELSRTKVLDGKCWSTPAYSNGRVYLRSTKEAACVELQ